jgi:hypothetical protein
VEITIFTGISIESFAATELQKYINKDDSSTVREQLTAGFDFSYRLVKPEAGSRVPTLWLYGETIHGARSGEARCEGDKQTTELCKSGQARTGGGSGSAAGDLPEGDNPGGVFWPSSGGSRIRRDSAEAAATVYLKGQLGMLTVAGRGGDVVDMHHAGVGLILTQGPFKNSYLELGHGTNELFVEHPERVKVDGFLSLGPDNASVRPFVQITIDADLDDGPDSIQRHFGFDVDVRKIWPRWN